MFFKFRINDINKINKIYHKNIRFEIKLSEYEKNIETIEKLKKNYNIRLKLEYDSLDFIEEGKIPNITTHLILPNGYEKIIKSSVLPDSIIFLFMGMAYNHPVPKGVFPKSLKFLIFKFDYDQEFEEGSLPPNLTHLKLSSRYNKPIKENILPSGLLLLNIPNKNLIQCKLPKLCKLI